MALKIEPNNSAVAYHVNDGATVFAYAVDARHAVSNFPMEWSDEPWSFADAQAAREKLAERHARDVEEAKALGLPVPKDLPPLPPEPTPEEQAAIMEHAQAVAEANERLKIAREKAAKRKAEEDQIAADEALVRSLPPQPDPTRKRPFGRPGEPTPAELEQIKKREAKKAADDKLVADKAEADKIGNAINNTTG